MLRGAGLLVNHGEGIGGVLEVAMPEPVGWANQTMELIELPRAGSPSAKKNLGKAVGKTTLAANEDYREYSQFRQVASGLPRSTKYRGVVAGRTNYTSGS